MPRALSYAAVVLVALGLLILTLPRYRHPWASSSDGNNDNDDGDDNEDDDGPLVQPNAAEAAFALDLDDQIGGAHGESGGTNKSRAWNLELVMRANRGAYPVVVSNKSANIVIWGAAWSDQTGLLELTGCPFSRKSAGGPFKFADYGCPLFPKCSFKWSVNNVHAHRADVLLVLITDRTKLTSDVLHTLPKGKLPYRVVYQREALWPIPKGQVARFDLDMSFRAESGITNPLFLRSPDFLMPKEDFFSLPRPNFAFSLISDCHTKSHREKYLSMLLANLGPTRLHRYGECWYLFIFWFPFRLFCWRGRGGRINCASSFSNIKRRRRPTCHASRLLQPGQTLQVLLCI